MTPEELNNAAAMAVLGWKETDRCAAPYTSACSVKYGEDLGWLWNNSDNTFYHRLNHSVPPPDMTLPENVVKMIEWLKPKPSTTDGRREAWDRLLSRQRLAALRRRGKKLHQFLKDG